ncbi:hypothetical protein PC119_g22379 [Phytophthora cactorum]|nr:hypothetical protein PC114_g22588 [Phytophthora cactorum]KAG2975822.1 hypothetical protein PC119_g22379 [Phytophthora cactorum]
MPPGNGANRASTSLTSAKKLSEYQLPEGIDVVAARNEDLTGHCFVMEVKKDGTRVAYDDMVEVKGKTSNSTGLVEEIEWIKSVSFVRKVERVEPMQRKKCTREEKIAQNKRRRMRKREKNHRRLKPMQ